MFKFFREKKIIDRIIEKSEGKIGYIFDEQDLNDVEGIKNLEEKFLNRGIKLDSFTANFVYPGTHSMLKVRKIKKYKIVK